MNVTPLKKRRNPNPSLRDHEERITEIEDFIGDVREALVSIKKGLTYWGSILLAGFAASGFIDGRAIKVIVAVAQAAGVPLQTPE